MPREIPGVLELSYARSCGTGNQPVPGTVTSRRDRGKQEKQKQLQKQREEEERLNKEREKFAEGLKRRWAKEDRERDGKERRRRRDEDEAQDGEAREVLERLRTRNARERSRSRSPPVEHAPAERRRAPEQHGGWQQVEVRRSGDATTGNSSSSGSTREAGGGEARSASSSKKPKPNVFGFGMEEDEEDPRRELELLAEKQRMKAQQRTSVALQIDSKQLAPQAQPADAAYQQLKRLADWKRACRGERRPMPKEMMDEMAKVANQQGGWNGV